MFVYAKSLLFILKNFQQVLEKEALNETNIVFLF